MNSGKAPAAGTLATAVDDGGPGALRGVVSASRPGGNSWIIDRWRDLLFIVALPLLLIPLLRLLQLQWSTSDIYLAVVTLGAVGHHLPGFLRIYADRDLFARYRARFLLAPVIMVGLGLGFAFAGYQGLSVILLVWGFWHILTQHYGFLRIYDAKIGSFELQTIWLDFLVCFFWFGAGVLYSPERMYELLDRFYAAGGPLLDPLLVNACQLLWGFLTALVTVAFVVNYVYQRRQGQAASLLKLLTLATGTGLWWFAMVNMHDLLAGVLLFELFHAIQYLALVRHYGGRRLELRGHVGPWAAPVFKRGWLGLALFLGVVGLYGLPALVSGISPTWRGFDPTKGVVYTTVFALVAASTLLHFYFDGFIWRIRSQQMRDTLELPEAAPDTIPAWRLSESVSHGLTWCLFLVPTIWIGTRQWAGTGPAAPVSGNLVEAVPGSWEAHARWGAELLERGRDLSEVGQSDAAEEYFREALGHLREATAIRPDAVGPQCSLGRALRQLKRFADARERLQRAAEAAPWSAQIQAELGKTLYELGQKAQGREHLLRAAALTPDIASIHYDLALAEARSQNFQRALVSIDNAIKLDATSADAFNARGNIHWNMNKLERALADFDKALKLDPQLVKAYRNRAQVWLARGNLRNTIADLSEAIKLDGTVSRDYVIRGDIFYSLHQFDQARADYAEAMIREKTHLEPLERMITFLTGCPDASYRDPDRAIRLAHTVCQQSNFTDPKTLQLLAATCATAGRYDEAIRWQERAIPVAPQELREGMRERVDQYKQAQANQQNSVERGAGERAKSASSDPTAAAAPSHHPPSHQ